MLYRYKDKVFVNPTVNRIVEVKIQKKGNEYDIVLTKNKVVQSNIRKEITEINVDEAYELQQENLHKPNNKIQSEKSKILKTRLGD